LGSDGRNAFLCFCTNWADRRRIWSAPQRSTGKQGKAADSLQPLGTPASPKSELSKGLFRAVKAIAFVLKMRRGTKFAVSYRAMSHPPHGRIFYFRLPTHRITRQYLIQSYISVRPSTAHFHHGTFFDL
jgi:hypothetical protein